MPSRMLLDMALRALEAVIEGADERPARVRRGRATLPISTTGQLKGGVQVRGHFPVPSLYLPCTFPVPSLYLPCTFPAGGRCEVTVDIDSISASFT